MWKKSWAFIVKNIFFSKTVLCPLSKRSAQHSGQILFSAWEHGTWHDIHVLGDDIRAWIEKAEPVTTPMSFHERTNGQYNTCLQLQRLPDDMQKKAGSGEVWMHSSLLSLPRCTYNMLNGNYQYWILNINL